ncbi:MAG: prevent-host-death protein [Acidobacteriota bacterium]|nr:prevent-host-death protein [Acidobacteriota bacterium]
MDTTSWRIGAAKQQFSEVVRRSQTEPQRIYNRNQLVAAVVSPEILNELEEPQGEQPGRTLADLFAEFRTICADEGYEVQVGERRNRKGWPEDLEGEDGQAADRSRAGTR